MLCFAPTVGIAKRLIDLGVDALIIEGHEAGGHIGPVSTSVLAEQILPYTSEVPVFVAGGIGSGLLMIHYLMMGASGVQLGTRLRLQKNRLPIPNFKQAILLKAAKQGCYAYGHSLIPGVPVYTCRSITNRGVGGIFTELLSGLGLIGPDAAKAPLSRQGKAGMKLEEFWIGGLRKAVVDGDIEHGSLMAGQSVGIVSEIKSVREI